MEPRLRFGIAGLGWAGQRVLPNFGKLPGLELTAVADVRTDALEAFRAQHGDVQTFASVEAMCQSPNVDAVWVATPTDLHAEHTITAARHGKHVICEKPLAVTLEDCDGMIDAAERNGVTLVAHAKAIEPPILKMREIVASGRLGRLIQMSTTMYKGWLLSALLPAEVDTSRGGGVVYRQAPHQIEILRGVGGGLVKSVRGITGRWDPHFDTEGNYVAFLEFEDGAAASLVFNGYGYFNVTELTWDIGEGGTKVSRSGARFGGYEGPIGPEIKYSRPAYGGGRQLGAQARDQRRYQPIYGLTLVSCERGDMRQSPDGIFVYTEEGCEEVLCEPYLDRGAELLELYAAVVHGRPFFTDGRWGKATLEVVLAILQSSRLGREIRLAHQVPTPV